ncbi:MAG: transglycosylase domain-containing protein [Bacteroidales bacterium]|nr:transglycosylase domain-containing protein [Bacteroidales bacterium]
MFRSINRIIQLHGWLYKLLLYFLIALFGLLLLAFFFRSSLASLYVQHKVEQFNREHPAKLKISTVRVRGLASVLITGVSLKPDCGETLFKADSIYASIGIVKLFAGRISLHQVQLINTSILLDKHDSIANWGFLLKKDAFSSDTVSGTLNYGATAERILNFVFDKIPLSLQVSNFNLAFSKDHHRITCHIDQLALKDHYFRSKMTIEEDAAKAIWVVAGKMDNHNRSAEVRIYAADAGKIVIPFINYQWNAKVDVDTLTFSFGETENENDETRIKGFASVWGLRVNHPKIASGEVEFERLSINYLINFGTDYIDLDSTSRITFNKIDFHPYVRYRMKPHKQITLRIHKPEFQAQDLFSSFPTGLFTNLDGIRVKGNLSWYLDFYVDLSIPDSLQFETALVRHQFSVLSYGNADLTMINRPFMYTAYEHDLPVRTFMVGPENPNFRPLHRISHYLQVAVMTSEDGGFYQHRGFLPDAFRESMVTNIKEHRFARGGSTISMQLVKNVFLSRNKTIGRKLEEAMLVWLIENQGLSTKDRMFEVYLNIIEWGPLIYGANEAARFYFNKDAANLTLNESIFLASIIPRPKWFKYSFDEKGHLRESNAGFYRLCSEKMLNKGWITQRDVDNLLPDVELKGPARMLLQKTDSIPPDSLELNDL